MISLQGLEQCLSCPETGLGDVGCLAGCTIVHGKVQKKSGLNQVSHSETMGFQGVFEAKGEEQKVLTFHFLAVEALEIGGVLNPEMQQDSAFPCLAYVKLSFYFAAPDESLLWEFNAFTPLC